jgi:hypothetical protein
MNVTLGSVYSQKFTSEIYDGTCVRQQFTAVRSHLISVKIIYNNFKKEISGSLTVQLLNSCHQVLSQVTIDGCKLNSGNIREFGLGVDLVVGKTYELKIFTSNCRSGESPSLAYGLQNLGGYFFVGSKLMRNQELSCTFKYL